SVDDCFCEGSNAPVYSEVQSSRINNALPLPSVLKGAFKIVEGPASSATGHPDEIAKLFLGLYGQLSVSVVPDQSDAASEEKLKIGVVLSGGQAPGGHNVISGLFDYLQERAKGSTFYGFSGSPKALDEDETELLDKLEMAAVAA
uniref:Phosphofructokinase domain-containing protein n=1 Tax=Brassica oleracea var. oleracea TaxID=109376 RepID=A0A0D3C439_BRAOL